MHGGCVEVYQAELSCYACSRLPDSCFFRAFAHQSKPTLLLTLTGSAAVAEALKKSPVQVRSSFCSPFPFFCLTLKTGQRVDLAKHNSDIMKTVRGVITHINPS